MMPRAPFGRMVRYVTFNGAVITGIVTAVEPDEQVNLHLFLDGVNQAHIEPHQYGIAYAPVRPDGKLQPDTWHWPPRD